MLAGVAGASCLAIGPPWAFFRTPTSSGSTRAACGEEASRRCDWMLWAACPSTSRVGPLATRSATDAAGALTASTLLGAGQSSQDLATNEETGAGEMRAVRWRAGRLDLG